MCYFGRRLYAIELLGLVCGFQSLYNHRAVYRMFIKNKEVKMSELDQAFVNELGVSVPRIARAMGRSRQTVYRGIHGDRPYFKAVDLAKALSYWQQTDRELYAVAQTIIRDIYPAEMADTVVAAASERVSQAFNANAPGEYWFGTGDFIGFLKHLSTCKRQLEIIAGNGAARLKLFVHRYDIDRATKWIRALPNASVGIALFHEMFRYPCSSMILQVTDNNMNLFGASNFGFITLSGHEAWRFRLMLYHYSEPLQLQEDA